MITDRTSLIEDLKRGIVEITFTKVDGSTRNLRGTLSPLLMPPQTKREDLQEADSFHKENVDVLAVWSINDAGWRSFRLENIQYLQVID